MLAKRYLLIVVAIAVFSLYLMFLLLTNFTDKATKYRPSTQEMRIYTEPVSNKEILISKNAWTYDVTEACQNTDLHH